MVNFPPMYCSTSGARLGRRCTRTWTVLGSGTPLTDWLPCLPALITCCRSEAAYAKVARDRYPITVESRQHLAEVLQVVTCQLVGCANTVV